VRYPRTFTGSAWPCLRQWINEDRAGAGRRGVPAAATELAFGMPPIAAGLDGYLELPEPQPVDDFRSAACGAPGSGPEHSSHTRHISHWTATAAAVCNHHSPRLLDMWHNLT